MNDWFYVWGPHFAQGGVAQAVKSMSDVQTSDPGGFTLMCICVGMLITLVLCLFAGTMFYFGKSKKRP